MNRYDPTPEQVAAYDEWVASRPPAVRAVAGKLFPWKLYRMDSGHRCWLVSFGVRGDGAVRLTVAVTGEYNRVAFERQVFDVDPDSLVECDLPAPGEALGALLTTPEEIGSYLEALREEPR